MSDFYIRTEDIANEQLLELFVETGRDREIIEAVKGPHPVVLVGSRGVGKSFLLKVASAELHRSLKVDGILPVYVSFTKSSLVQFSKPELFPQWMLAKICNAVVRALGKEGVLAQAPKQVAILSGDSTGSHAQRTKLEQIEDEFESSWKTPDKAIDVNAIPDTDAFKNAIEDVCRQLQIKRIALLIDEAAHVFIPQQQRAFFTLFRDLRSPYITCNAAIYPGVTSFGDTFQPAHDATFISIDRDPMGSDYIPSMREIVEKQASSETLRDIARNGELFAILAYAASGNPRLLLKTLLKVKKLNSTEVNDVFRTFYRTEIWAEHSVLAEKYPGHKHLIDWGRNFIESIVLTEIQKKNIQYLEIEKNTSAFFWIHRDAPIGVRHALQILSYTGVVAEHSVGVKATRAEIGTRYVVNLGCLFALESNPAQSAFGIAKALSTKRMTEYGANNSIYAGVQEVQNNLEDLASNRQALMSQLAKPIDALDITAWQKSKLVELKLMTVADVLRATENELKKANYVGDVRARQMRNAAEAAVYEYLSG